MIGQLPKAEELAAARAKLYQLLGAVYIRPPAPDFLKFLAGWVASLTGAEEVSPRLSEAMGRALSALNGFFRRMGDNPWREVSEAASVEFTRLFRGVKRHYSPLPPYESVYREDSSHVFGEVTMAVHHEYRRFGLDLANGLSGEPPDHISFELEFMYFLCRQEAEAWERGDEEEALRLRETEHEFLAEHLLTWLPKFCDEVRKHDQLGLFCSLADLTEGWVNFDYQQNLPGISRILPRGDNEVNPG